MMTYWLYFGREIVGSVRLPPGADPNHVRFIAQDWHNRVPLCGRPNEAPYERARKIARSEVVTYPGGN